MTVQIYGTGSNSSIGTQLRTDFIKKKALIEAAKQMFFGQLADVESMPKNMGKTIKVYHYLPMLDDANLTDQGIDADGISTTFERTVTIIQPGVTGSLYNTYYAVGEAVFDTNAATTNANALAAAKTAALLVLKNLGVVDASTGLAYTVYATADSELTALGWVFGTGTASIPESGNLYGSSKDVGTITGKLPALSEEGGRINRVGFKRTTIEGTLEKFGFFTEYTQESLDFDTDTELEMHIHRELVNGANEITEDALQIDLLSSPGIIRFGGDATSTLTLTGETGAVASLITYEDLMRVSIELDQNRCPKSTQLISGSRMVDTKTINSARYLYIGSELEPMVKKMEDLFGNPAFIPVHQYADSSTIAVGEIGSIDQFRIIVVPEMMHWEDAGATVTNNDGYRQGATKYNVYPMLCVGSGSFTTIGFQTDGKTTKFTINHKKPGPEMVSTDDPFGEKGVLSIKWYYGFMALRPERIAILKTVAEW